MHIGITTFQWSDNYGAVLQAHALQSVLQQAGHQVEIVDYRSMKAVFGLRRWLSLSPQGCLKKWETNRKKHLFEKFRRRYLHRSLEVFHKVSDLQMLADRYDLLITGSDQVWNPTWLAQVPGYEELYFLSFAGSSTRRIYYAASLGHAETATIDEKWKRILKEKLNAMDSISVREQSGINLVRMLCGRDDAVQVVDPTLLLGRDHFEALSSAPRQQPAYLFSYMLHGLDHEAGPSIECISDSLGLQIVRCDARKSSLHKRYELPSPAGWLGRINHAGFMITNSFHGVVFCLIFHTPFIALLLGGSMGSMNARIVDLLDAVGLSKRILSPGQPIPGDMLNEAIDWNQVDRCMADKRQASVEFLREQCKSVKKERVHSS
jgi:hypothetical protein